MLGGKFKLGGKLKRGELGSVEEEQTCKRSNMASEENEFIDVEINVTEAEEPYAVGTQRNDSGYNDWTLKYCPRKE